MPKIADERTIEYAYDQVITLTANTPYEIKYLDKEGVEQIKPGFRDRITIEFDLRTVEKLFIDQQPKEFYSEPSEVKSTSAQRRAWRDATEAEFIAIGKKELANFPPSQG